MDIKINVTLTLPDDMPESFKNYLDAYFRPLLAALAPTMNPRAEEQQLEEVFPADEPEAPDSSEVATTDEDDGDLPYSVSNEDLRAAVKEARAKVGSQAIWNLFARYGIGASIECPDEKRPQFYAELKSLAA